MTLSETKLYETTCKNKAEELIKDELRCVIIFFSNSDFNNFFNKRIATDCTEDFAEVQKLLIKMS